MVKERMLNEPPAPGRLRGKVSVISGEGFGTGAAVARLFRDHGAKVAMMGCDGRVLETAVPGNCPDSLGYLGDAGSVRDLQDFHKRALARFGKSDILVVNAGGSASVLKRFPVRYPEFFAKNAFHAVKLGLPFLADGASIVLTTPYMADAGVLGDSAQAVCKQAMRYFVRVFSNECAQLGIRVNAVVPSRTAMAAECGQARALVADSILDVARAALFLASDESRPITGEEIFADRMGAMPPRGNSGETAGEKKPVTT